jgi:hypothetical protein
MLLINNFISSFQILAAVLMKFQVFRNMAQYLLVNGYWRFGGDCSVCIRSQTDDVLLWKVGNYLPSDTALYSRRLESSFSVITFSFYYNKWKLIYMKRR